MRNNNATALLAASGYPLAVWHAARVPAIWQGGLGTRSSSEATIAPTRTAAAGGGAGASDWERGMTSSARVRESVTPGDLTRLGRSLIQTTPL